MQVIWSFVCTFPMHFSSTFIVIFTAWRIRISSALMSSSEDENNVGERQRSCLSARQTEVFGTCIIDRCWTTPWRNMKGRINFLGHEVVLQRIETTQFCSSFFHSSSNLTFFLNFSILTFEESGRWSLSSHIEIWILSRKREILTFT